MTCCRYIRTCYNIVIPNRSRNPIRRDHRVISRTMSATRFLNRFSGRLIPSAPRSPIAPTGHHKKLNKKKKNQPHTQVVAAPGRISMDGTPHRHGWGGGPDLSRSHLFTTIIITTMYVHHTS